MITRCDHCGSRFQVSADLVNSEDPQVRCGECMTLFDARLNLYNEAESHKASTQYKPVQRKKASEVVAQHVAAGDHELEAADTVASEHFYTRESNADRVHGGVLPDYSPDINLESASSSTDEYIPHWVNREVAANLEFERTMATESRLDDALIDRTVDNGIDDPVIQRRYPSNPMSTETSFEPSDSSAKTEEQVVGEKKRQLAERERRALAIESDRQLSEQHMHQLEEVRARGKDQLKSAPVELDLDLQSDTAKSTPVDYAFIPDDVLKKPAVYRDDGRREENLKFDNNTPRFDTSMPDISSAPSAPSAPSASSAAEETEESVKAQQQQRRDDRHRPEDTKHSDAQHSQARRKNRHSDERSVHESSAQEMRRYRQHRPSVEVSEYREPETVRRRSYGFKPLLWLAGLVAALCICLFVARDLIANMNLPDPLMSSFCRVTGCVPAEVKKDVSQIEATRSRLFPHPDVESVLVISVDVVNNSVYKQPYPTLDVELFDSEGTTVGERSFSRVNYEVIDRGESEFLIPGEITRIKIELIDSGLNATDMNLVFQ